MKDKTLETQEEHPSGVVVFSFYSSFWEAGKNLKAKDRLALYDAIVEYCFVGKEPEFSGVLAALFALARPNIDASNRRRLAGSVGGKSTPKKTEESSEQMVEKKVKTSSSHSASTKSKSKGKVKENVKKNKKENATQNANANESIYCNQEQATEATGEAPPPYVSPPSTNDEISFQSTTATPESPWVPPETNDSPTQAVSMNTDTFVNNSCALPSNLAYGTPPTYISPYDTITPYVDYSDSTFQTESNFSPQEDAQINQHIADVAQQYEASAYLPPTSPPLEIQERLPIDNNSYYEITYPQLDAWSEQYPNVDIHRELEKIKVWMTNNSPQGRSKEKAKNTVEKWLREEEEKAVHKINRYCYAYNS